MLKDIINTEARFNNRKREKGWLCPTARHLIETHLNMIDRICQILPVTEWTLETNKFAFMKMDGDAIYGVDYQNGRMRGLTYIVIFTVYRTANVRSAVVQSNMTIILFREVLAGQTFLKILSVFVISVMKQFIQETLLSIESDSRKSMVLYPS